MDCGATEISNLRDVGTAGGKYGLAHTEPSHEGSFHGMARRHTGPPVPSRDHGGKTHRRGGVEKKGKATMEMGTGRLGNG